MANDPCATDGGDLTQELAVAGAATQAGVATEAGSAVPWLDAICGPTEMGQRVRTFDWASTPLGDPSGWPQGLRAAVGICMASRFPMLVVWGPELTKIYNDGYRPMLGADKHPEALGAPAAEVWQEIWDTIGPMFASVIDTGEPTWSEDQLLILERNGFAEDCFFTWSYSPIFDDDGTIGGVLDVVQETTAAVVSEQRFQFLARLSADLAPAEQITDVCRVLVSTLADPTSDFEGADVYLALDDELSLIASNRRVGLARLDDQILGDLMSRSSPVVLGAPPSGTSGPAQRCLIPLKGRNQSAEGALVLDLNPGRAFDDAYRQYLDLVGGVLTAALDSAFRHAEELGDFRQLKESLHSVLLRPASDLPTVAARYLPAANSLALGGDWYDIIELAEDRRAIVVGDCVGHGLEAATVMAQLRSAGRAMLLEGNDPAQALTALDAFATTLPGSECTTAVFAIVDRRRNTLTYSRAGHPPPLVVSGTEVTWLDGACGLPLGVAPERARPNETLSLASDSTLVLYSDGLIERPGESLDVGLARLAEAARAATSMTVQDLADHLLDELTPQQARDDVIVVVKHLPPHKP